MKYGKYEKTDANSGTQPKFGASGNREVRLEKCDKIIKIADFAALVVFILGWSFYDIYIATAVFMAVIIPVTLAAFVWYRCMPRMQILMLVLVVFFGGMTLYLEDPAFIKIKPTVMLGGFAVMAFVSVWLNKPFMNLMIPPQAFQGGVSEEAIAPLLRSMTLRFGWLFLLLAVLNEVVWRTQSEGFWVYYKFFGSLGITFAFLAFHVPWLKKRAEELQKKNTSQYPSPLLRVKTPPKD